MPTWSQLLNKFESLPSDGARSEFVRSELLKYLKDISRLRGNRHVIFYGSAFLQKPQAPADRLPNYVRRCERVHVCHAWHDVE